jgi:hypothetical protein
MKSGTNKTTTPNSIPMVITTNDDLSDPNNLKAIHSIEAILGIKNGDNHHQQHLFPSHLLPPSSLLQFHQQNNSGFENKKKNSNGQYPDGK